MMSPRTTGLAALPAAARSVDRYIVFVAASLVLSVAVLLLIGVAQGPWAWSSLAAVPQGVLFVLLLGWLIWGPIVAFAFIPGLGVFLWSLTRCRALGVPWRLGLVLAAIGVGMTGWAGLVMLTTWFGTSSLAEVTGSLAWLLVLGLPSAVLVAQIVYGWSAPDWSPR